MEAGRRRKLLILCARRLTSMVYVGHLFTATIELSDIGISSTNGIRCIRQARIVAAPQVVLRKSHTIGRPL